MIPSTDFFLTSRVWSVRDNHWHPSNGIISTIGWVLIFHLALSLPQSALAGATTMFNGWKYESVKKGSNVHHARGGHAAASIPRRGDSAWTCCHRWAPHWIAATAQS
jgi:hypothetical protein